MNEGQFRLDLPALDLPKDTVIELKKDFGARQRSARQAAKPSSCALCGKQASSFCNSHSLPQFVLRQIAVDGKLYTTAKIVSSPALPPEKGIKETATFHLICNDCDQAVFSGYESFEALTHGIDDSLLAQIATKTYLYEMGKSAVDTQFFSKLYEDYGVENNRASVRALDNSEDKAKLDRAFAAISKPKNLFEVLYYDVSPYTAPIACQTMITPFAGFDGKLINNLFNQSPAYKTEPIHICVFPSKNGTVVLLFYSKQAKRYREFRKEFQALDRQTKLKVVTQMLFAYTEEIYISKQIDEVTLEDPSLVSAASMNIDYIAFASMFDKSSKSPIQIACEEYSVDALPDVPSLLGEEYAITP